MLNNVLQRFENHWIQYVGFCIEFGACEWKKKDPKKFNMKEEEEEEDEVEQNK